MEIDPFYGISPDREGGVQMFGEETKGFEGIFGLI